MIVCTLYRINKWSYLLSKFTFQASFSTLGITGFDPKTDTLLGTTLSDKNYIDIGLLQRLENTPEALPLVACQTIPEMVIILSNHLG